MRTKEVVCGIAKWYEHADRVIAPHTSERKRVRIRSRTSRSRRRETMTARYRRLQCRIKLRLDGLREHVAIWKAISQAHADHTLAVVAD